MAATLVVLLAACGSMGGLGGVLGGPQSSSYPSTQSIYGTVNSVDTRNQRIDLTVNDSNGTRRNTTVYYDSRTRVTYQNQQGSPANLERGDQVEVQLTDSGNGQAIASTINVTQSVSSSSTYPNNTYPSSQTGNIQGTVNYIDTAAHRIDISANYVNGLRNTPTNYSIYYDGRTRVMYQGRTYSPADLERGDQVDVSTYNSNGQSIADTITVTRNVRQ